MLTNTYSVKIYFIKNCQTLVIQVPVSKTNQRAKMYTCSSIRAAHTSSSLAIIVPADAVPTRSVTFADSVMTLHMYRVRNVYFPDCGVQWVPVIFAKWMTGNYSKYSTRLRDRIWHLLNNKSVCGSTAIGQQHLSQILHFQRQDPFIMTLSLTYYTRLGIE